MGESRHYREFGLKYALNSVWLNPLTAALREGTTVCIDKVIGASRLAVGGVWINRRGVLGLNTAGKEEQRQSARTHRCWHAEWRQALPVVWNAARCPHADSVAAKEISMIRLHAQKAAALLQPASRWVLTAELRLH